ncbi:hypothetical protein BRARA_D00298 [Brassica rapa]|uniref:glucan endo-1,3-beta-D-glucosidase n=1 Tax=Brassica campestris TaxID=3711 RepID=A0A397ZJA4_BRACM|nr:hypothetical protein BRARA_D00298 [Brassica rapa]
MQVIIAFNLRFYAVGFLLASFLDTEAGQIGVCYGKIGNNLPHPVDVVAFYRQRNIHLMWLYDPDQEVLTALNGSNLELLLDVPNSDIQRIASNQSEADTWVRKNVRNYTKGVRFRYISVGNEMQPSDLDAMFLLQAMQNIERAVSDLGVKVSNGFSGFPPSSGSFTPDSRIFFTPVIDFLKTVVNDGSNSYRNLFLALLDTIYAALEKTGSSHWRSWCRRAVGRQREEPLRVWTMQELM